MENKSDHLHDVTKMMPLTLEQLRQMENPTPVWAKPEKKTIEAWDGYWCICHRGHIITPGLVSMYADKMNGVTFYAYLPAQIDLEAWEPCQECEKRNCDNCLYSEYLRNMEPCKSCYNAKEWKPISRFCGECGRPLTTEARAMMEKRLRG